MPKKKTNDVRDVVSRILCPRQAPIELTDELRQRFAELEPPRTLTYRPCEVCGYGQGIPKMIGSDGHGRWKVCLPCVALLDRVDRQTRHKALWGEMDHLELMRLRLPYFRAWFTGEDLMIEREAA